ncbi:hypothetical protein FB451DRAFT_450979 [Mycena latifolia]|nr:hypothetical protein FB451DRAFT_450979 [Mycena latifolia]
MEIRLNSTKIAILEELATRAGSEEDALVLIHSNMLIGPSAAILKNMASHSKSTSAAVIEPLEALLRDSNENDVSFASDVLSEITASQVTVFMERNYYVPLAPETVEIYSSYLLWKYVSTSTKRAILEELETRAGSEEDARVLMHSNINRRRQLSYRTWHVTASPRVRLSVNHLWLYYVRAT